MHPLLTRPARLGLYLLAWAPLAGLSIYVLVSRGGLGWVEATTLVVPVFLLYAFMCLSAWYPCRGTPLGKVGFIRLVLTHLIAAALLSFLWIQGASALAYGVLKLEKFQDLDHRFGPQIPAVFTVGILLYLLSVAFHYVLLSFEESQQAEARTNEARVLARDAELKALKAQVNPHFLFNSLNSISALTTADPEKAREMCILLADFLRMTLGLGAKSSIPLAEELTLLRCYLAIEKVRFGSRLTVVEAVQEEAKSALVPPLLLQPLVENAITHGIAHLPEGGAIRIGANSTDGLLSILIENSFDSEAPPVRRGGMGLQNVRQRLEARYGNEASLNVSAKDGRFDARLTLPAESEETSQ